MKRICLVLPAAALLLVAAAPVPEPSAEELLREGTAAFARGDYAAAVKVFTAAEDLTDDPGQVAFNKGAALYRMALPPSRLERLKEGRQRTALLREAAECYRLCLEDATETRRWAALYGLGNCLLQQYAGGSPRVLFDAISCYEQVLAGDADPQLKEDARHNLELAKLLWAQAQAPPASDPDDKPPNNPDTPSQPQDPKKPPPSQGDGSTTGTLDPSGAKVQVKPEQGQEPTPIDQPGAPGSRPLPPVLENGEPLPPGDALEHIRRAVAAIQREKQEYQRKPTRPPARGVKDW